MRKSAIIAIILAAVLLMLILEVPVGASDIVPQTWYLHSKTVPGGYVMDLTNSDENNGEVSELPIAAGGSMLWISDQPVKYDTQYSSGKWQIVLFTADDWGQNGSACGVTVGTWNGSNFSGFDLSTSASVYVNPSQRLGQIGQQLTQKAAFVVNSGEYLAIQIANRDSLAHKVYTAEYVLGTRVSGVIGGTITVLPVKNSPTTTTPLPSDNSSAGQTTTPSSLPPITNTAVPTISAATSIPVIHAPTASLPSTTASSVPSVAATALVAPVMPVPIKPPAVPSITSVPAAADINATSNSTSPAKTPLKSTASENKSSFGGGILAVVLAMIITIVVFIAVITVSRIIIKRRNRKTQGIK